jgi:hypothetical protein
MEDFRKIKNKRYSVHSITDTENLSFSARHYSRFKYGDFTIAEKFGHELVSYFRGEILPMLKSKNITVLSSPYSYLPTASYHLTSCFLAELRELNLGFNISEGKIDRKQTYVQDYGAMSAEERYSLIKNDTYSIPNQPNQNSTLLFLDDISITGTHQLVVEKLLHDLSISNQVIFLYYATLDNKHISPEFESALNCSAIKTTEHLTQLVLNGSFKITTRAVKFLLCRPPEELIKFIQCLSENNMNHMVMSIINGAKKNNYDLIDEYKSNFTLLVDFQ